MGRGTNQAKAASGSAVRSEAQDPNKNAVVYREDSNVPQEVAIAETSALLEKAGAIGWEVFTVDGHKGIFVQPKYGVPVSEFTTVLFALGSGWMFIKDPRSSQ